MVVLGFLAFVFSLSGLFLVDDFCSCPLLWYGFSFVFVLGFLLCVCLAWFCFYQKEMNIGVGVGKFLQVTFKICPSFVHRCTHISYVLEMYHVELGSTSPRFDCL